MIKTTPKVLTWWLTGLSGAGKTTLANGLAARLAEQGAAVRVLDGDHLRQGLCSDLGFSLDDRSENMRRVAEVARLFNESGVFVIAALVSPTQAGRQVARSIIGEANFIESYIATPLAICQQRDVKGLYARAKANPSFELTGIRSPYEAPSAAKVVIDTSVSSIDEGIEALIDAAGQPAASHWRHKH